MQNDGDTTTYTLAGASSQTLIGRSRFVHVGRVKSPRRWQFRRHQHDEYECLLIRQGRIRYWTDDIDAEAGRHDVYFVQPGQSHREETLDAGLDFYFLKFYLQTPDNKTAYLFPPPGDPRKQRLRDSDGRLRQLFESILQEVKQERPGSLEICEAIIMQMLWLIMRHLDIIPEADRTQDLQGTRQNLLIEQSRVYLEQNLHRLVPLTELARYCNLSPDHFWHRFKQATGSTPRSYAMALRMTEACRLLRETDMAVFQIAERLGFAGPSHFTSTFRTRKAMRPTAYRKAHTLQT